MRVDIHVRHSFDPTVMELLQALVNSRRGLSEDALSDVYRRLLHAVERAEAAAKPKK